MKMSINVRLPSNLRTCSECDRMSIGGTCLSKVEPRPNPRELRQCTRFVALRESYDSRSGRELWPEIAISEEYGGGLMGFLASQLVFGPVAANDIISRAQMAGVSKRSIQRVAEKIPIRRTKSRFRGGWLWALPDSEDAKQWQGFQRKMFEPKC